MRAESQLPEAKIPSCQLCGDGGDVNVCAICQRAYHTECDTSFHDAISSEFEDATIRMDTFDWKILPTNFAAPWPYLLVRTWCIVLAPAWRGSPLGFQHARIGVLILMSHIVHSHAREAPSWRGNPLGFQPSRKGVCVLIMVLLMSHETSCIHMSERRLLGAGIPRGSSFPETV